MKKYILSLVIVASTLMVVAQSTSPRFGTTKLGDNTGRSLTYGIKTAIVTVASVTIQPSFYETFYLVPTNAITSSINVNVASSFFGDHMTVFIAANATLRTIALGNNIICSTASFALPVGKKAAMFLVFDGAKWNTTGPIIEQ